MTKLTDEELRKLLRRYAAASYAYTVAERDSDDESKAEAKSNELEAEIIKRMAEGAAGSTSPQPKWPLLDPESGDFTDGWNQAIDLCRQAFAKWAESGSASTAGPRPIMPRCPQGAEDAITQIIWDYTNGQKGGRMCRTAARSIIARFFAAAPAEDAKEK